MAANFKTGWILQGFKDILDKIKISNLAYYMTFLGALFSEITQRGRK